jgi:UDP-glucose 4-epimerase
MTNDRYRGKQVLVTGGLGFIGSNVALALWREGAAVTVIDGVIPGCGANEHNLDPAGGAIRVVRADIGEAEAVAEVLPACQVIFNLAGEISHPNSILSPERDLDLNARSQLRFLESCRRLAPSARIVYASSRQVYGTPEYLPVDERHPVNPTDFNGVHKLAAERYHRLFSAIHGLETVSLRLTNVYGPRQALHLPWQGFIGTFFARALRGEPLSVFGDGSQLRDMLYVDDAVEAFLRAGLAPLPGEARWIVCNLGGPRPLTLTEIARTLVGERLVHVPFPEDRRKIDIGSYYTDNRRFQSWTGWVPQVDFAEGAARTLAFYREHVSIYLPSGADRADRSAAGAPAVLRAVASQTG